MRSAFLISNLNQDYVKSAKICQEAFEADPYKAESYQSIMSFLMKAGNYVETAKVYYQYKNMLYNEVGLNPGGRTEKLFEELNILSNKDLNFLEKISGNSQNYIPYSM